MLMLSVMCRHPNRGQVAGVLEVIQTSEDMVFSDLVEIISQVPADALWVYMCLCLGHCKTPCMSISTLFASLMSALVRFRFLAAPSLIAERMMTCIQQQA